MNMIKKKNMDLKSLGSFIGTIDKNELLAR
jgi:hypothetical protein